MNQASGNSQSGSRPEYFTAQEFFAPDNSCMIRVTGRRPTRPQDSRISYSYEIARPKKETPTNPAGIARFFQVYTSVTLGVVRISNPVNQPLLFALIAQAEFWILTEVQKHEDATMQEKIDKETRAAGSGKQAPKRLKTLGKQDGVTRRLAEESKK